MRNTAKEWSLSMIFSEHKSNEFVADVRLLITDNQGVPCLQLSGAGTIAYAGMPPDHYRIAAGLHGKVEKRAVTLDGNAAARWCLTGNALRRFDRIRRS